MDIRHKLFPYPVLRELSDDYIGSSFDSLVDVAKEGYDIIFRFMSSTNNLELAQLIADDKAEYVFHIECSQTSYRTIVRSPLEEFQCRIPEGKLNGKVNVCHFIIAKQHISDFTNKQFNSDYSGITFIIEKGNILAIGKQHDISIDKELEELTKIPSIFCILRKSTDEILGNTLVPEPELEQDKIKIWLPSQEYYDYQRVVRRLEFQPATHSMVIFPSLIYIFEEIKRSGISEYEDFRWFKSLHKALQKFNFNLDDQGLNEKSSFELAQMVLNMPITRSLDSLANINDEEEAS